MTGMVIFITKLETILLVQCAGTGLAAYQGLIQTLVYANIAEATA